MILCVNSIQHSPESNHITCASGTHGNDLENLIMHILYFGTYHAYQPRPHWWKPPVSLGTYEVPISMFRRLRNAFFLRTLQGPTLSISTPCNAPKPYERPCQPKIASHLPSSRTHGVPACLPPIHSGHLRRRYLTKYVHGTNGVGSTRRIRQTG